MGEPGEVEVVVVDTGTGRTATVDAGADATVEQVLASGYEQMGEARRADDHFYDDNGAAIGDLGGPVRSLAACPDGSIVVEIRHPTGGGGGTDLLQGGA